MRYNVILMAGFFLMRVSIRVPFDKMIFLTFAKATRIPLVNGLNNIPTPLKIPNIVFMNCLR